MIKILFVSVIIVLFPFKIYGKNIDGKGIICENLDDVFFLVPVIGLWFEKNEVSLFYKSNNGLKKSIDGKYKQEDFKISFNISKPHFFMGKHTVDRNSGKLTHINYQFMCDEIFTDKTSFLEGFKITHELNIKKSPRLIDNENKEYEMMLKKRKF